MQIEPYDPRHLDAVISLSLRAWTPVFDSIQKAMNDFLPKLPDEVIVSGGGVHNQTLMNFLSFEFPPEFRTSDELGVSSAAKEAIAFALLGAATLDGLPSNMPSVTGARKRVVLGSITARP